MANSNRNRKNQPPTGTGKRQPRTAANSRKLDDRSEVAQAQRHQPELNLGDSEDEARLGADDQQRSPRRKAGR
jgi:hypothetical protein